MVAHGISEISWSTHNTKEEKIYIKKVSSIFFITSKISFYPNTRLLLHSIYLIIIKFNTNIVLKIYWKNLISILLKPSMRFTLVAAFIFLLEVFYKLNV